MTSQIYLCFTCGSRNRIADGADLALAKCGACGSALFPNKSRQTRPQKSSGVRAEPAGKDNNKKQSNAPEMIGAVVILLLIVGVMFMVNFNADEGARTSTSSSPTQRQTSTNIAPKNTDSPTSQIVEAQKPLPPQVHQTPGLMWNRTGKEPQAPLEIVTQQGSDYFLKLVDAATGKDAIAFFAHGGARLKVDVPLGNYKMRYAAGETWRGEEHLFGPDRLTSYSEAGSIFRFYSDGHSVSGYTVELILQRGGNLQTKRIDPTHF